MRSKNQLIMKLIAAFILQVFLVANTAYAEDIFSNANSSSLSPTVNIGFSNFKNSFYGISLSKNWSLVKKELIPSSVQAEISQAIREKIPQDIDLRKTKSIQVRFKRAEDTFINNLYKLFLDGKIREVSDLLIVDRPFRDLGKKLRMKRVIEHIASYENYSKKEMIDLQRRYEKAISDKWADNDEIKPIEESQLWAWYFKVRNSSEFKKQMLSSLKDSPVVFDVFITLESGNISEELIVGSENGQIVARFARQSEVIIEQTKDTSNQATPETFDERIQKIEDDNFRGHMHTMQSQKKDLIKVVDAIERLRQIREVDLADWQSGVREERREDAKKTLTEITSWLSKTPKSFKGKIQSKYIAFELLDKIIKKRGKLAHKDYRAVIEHIDKAVEHLNDRTRFLIQGIAKRNVRLLEFAIEKQEHYFYKEVIKNELKAAEAAIRIHKFSIALSKIEYLESKILSQAVFRNKLVQDSAFVDEVKRIRFGLDKADRANLATDAIKRIREIEENKFQTIEKLVNSLSAINKWFSNKGFTGYAAELTPVIRELKTASNPGANFYQVLDRSLRMVDALAQNISKTESKKISPLKKTIALKFAGPKSMLNDMLGKILMRHEAIKKALRDEKVTGADQAIKLLEKNFREKSGYDSYELMQADLIEQIQNVDQILTEIQSGFTHKQEFLRVGEIIPGVIERFSESLNERQMVGQAI